MNFDEMKRKHTLLRDLFRGQKSCNLRIHDMKKSYLEGFMSRGDERTGDLIELAWKGGAKLDDYKDNFNIWKRAIEELGIKEEDYLQKRDIDQDLPWDMVEISVDKEFLKKELKQAEQVTLTPECRSKCSNCGMRKRFPNCMVISD